ncbi:MAG: electron transport complex subunit RsxC, partial [Ichthyobacteriaceae bacterium]|nr:electron transport complex subunit RsxC [Ichthyobacteriaceae bacterium]
MGLKTFPKGGVHPEENKLSENAAIEFIAPQEKGLYVIPVSQHIGAPAKVVVKKNEEVKVGTLLAQSGGFVSANIHSSVSGKVKKIELVTDASGYKRQAVIIQADGEDAWEESIDRSEELVTDIKATADEIKKKVSEFGIVGLGGATFPAHVKLAVPDGETAEYLMLNGVECEPYLTSDHRMMLEKGEEIMVGIKILMTALGVSKAMIGIENNKPDAIKNMEQIAAKYNGISVHPLKVQYPQGGEKQLIAALLGREVPSGKLPIHVGCVVQNVGTAFAVYEAVQKNKPMLERVVTLTGKSVEKPANYLVRMGTPIEHLVARSGGLPADTGKIINGGPMMGKAIDNTDVPVTKGTSGVLIMKQDESKRGDINPCIRCAKCVSVCPAGLEPFLLMTLAEKRMW